MIGNDDYVSYVVQPPRVEKGLLDEAEARIAELEALLDAARLYVRHLKGCKPHECNCFFPQLQRDIDAALGRESSP